MHTSERGVAFIAAHEGVVTRAYRDVAGIWTIGVGHTAAAGPPVPVAGMTISREEAFDILARDLPKYERRTARALGSVPQHVFDGAVSFDFNTGAIDRASWVAAFRAGDRANARARLMLWNKAGGRMIAGLVKRREAEARLIFDAEYGREASAASAAPAPAGTSWSAVQADLATLGFYKGGIDGIAGPETRAAVIAYQRSHPDLAVDGVVGPATLASLARDVAARKSLGEATGAALGGAIVAGGGAVAAGAGRPLLIATLAGLGLIAVTIAFVAHRYGGELTRILPKLNRRSA